MSNSISRRGFLAGAMAGAGAFSVAHKKTSAGEGLVSKGIEGDISLVDYHVHLDQVVTLEKALQLSKERGVKFGIVEHAGTKENKYANLISDDEGMKRYIAMLEGKPVCKGIQAEGLDWLTCFSKEVVAQLDFVLSDALTFPEKDGKRVELWRTVKIEDKQDFMDRYTDFNVQVIAREPIDILANPTFLPNVLKAEHDALWTPARMKKIIDAAVKHNVAIEINSNYRLPRVAFLKMAKQDGARFSFGSNIHGLDVGKLDYCVEVVKELGLKREDIFTPAPAGKKPIEIRKFA
jgi:histidinol phosphatase-like PHP family hydrolase